MPPKKGAKKAAAPKTVTTTTTTAETARATRATRSSVRAGSAALEELPEPPKRASRKRSTSASVSNSQAHSMVTTEPSPPPTSSSIEQEQEETSKNISSFTTDEQLSDQVSDRELNLQIQHPILIDGHAVLAFVIANKTPLKELTRLEIEAMTTVLLIQKEQYEKERRRLNGQVSDLQEDGQMDQRAIQELKRTVRDVEARNRRGSIRRHFSVEEPAAEFARQQRKEAQAAEAAAKAKEEENAAKEADLKEREAKIAAEEAQSSQFVLQPKTPRTATKSLFEELPATESASPSSWNLTSIFGSAKKVFASPFSRRLYQMRTNRVDSRVPSPIQEESPGASQSTPRSATQSASTSASQSQEQEPEVQEDLSEIVRKRKAQSTPQPQTPKKAKLASNSSTKDLSTDNTVITPPTNKTPMSHSQGQDHSSNDDVTMEPPPTVRRTAKSVRAQRQADASAKLHAADPQMAYILLTKKYIRRPPPWELIGGDDYLTQEELNTAIDAMLTIEEAEDNNLPTPQINVKPAQRIYERVRPEGARPPPVASFIPARYTQQKKATPREPNADKRQAQAQAEAEKAAVRKRLQEKAQQLKEEQRKAEDALRALEEDSHEVGKKRKRVKVDQLKTIPSRRPGQSSGTFAMLDEFFGDSDDDSVEMDEDEIELITPRPTKMARTETNIFEAVSGNSPPTPTPMPPQPMQQPIPQATTLHQPGEALLKARAAAEKYKPKDGSRLREVQRNSTGSSISGSPAALPAVLAPVKTLFAFPEGTKIFSDEVVAALPPASPEHQAACLAKFRAGLEARFPGSV